VTDTPIDAHKELRQLAAEFQHHFDDVLPRLNNSVIAFLYDPEGFFWSRVCGFAGLLLPRLTVAPDVINCWIQPAIHFFNPTVHHFLDRPVELWNARMEKRTKERQRLLLVIRECSTRLELTNSRSRVSLDLGENSSTCIDFSPVASSSTA